MVKEKPQRRGQNKHPTATTVPPPAKYPAPNPRKPSGR
jgi:hypothetical protein